MAKSTDEAAGGVVGRCHIHSRIHWCLCVVGVGVIPDIFLQYLHSRIYRELFGTINSIFNAMVSNIEMTP